jgi:alcohol dehydrogenase
LTAASGADALGHALEAFLSRQANPVTSLLASRAVALIVENLPRAVRSPDDPGPREPLALAAVLAGAAFNEAGVIVGHALAHGLGAVLRVSHAEAVAIGTPVHLRYNFEERADRYAELAEACRLPDGPVWERARRFVDAIAGLLQSVGLPDRVPAPPGAPADLADRLVESALQSTRTALTLNPRKVDAGALRALFAECVTGLPGGA